ncbi:MAG TPA: hypothetical protein VGW38_20830, partial [Chloroflexota bacterium]|nr:hypothetical protein [Chloroflexota bacterium]
MISKRGRTRAFAVLAGLVATAVTLGTASAATPASTWRSEYADPQNTGYNPSESVLDVAAAKTLRSDWGNRDPGLGSFTPVVGVNRIIVPCPAGLCALDSSGTPKWSVPSPGIPSPTIADSTVFAVIASHPITLAALRASDGKELWRRSFPYTGSMYAAPVWFGGTLY